MNTAETLSTLASLYALDTLDPLDASEQVWAEDTYGNSTEFQAEVADLTEVVAMLAYAATPMVPPSNLKAKLFERITTESVDPVPLKPDPQAENFHFATPFKAPLTESLATLQKQAQNAQWEAYPFTPGVEFATLQIHPESRQLDCFVRSFGQVKFPHHRHAGDEQIVVLDGDLVIGNQHYVKGDRIYSQPGTEHQPETAGGCLLFLRTSLDDEILS